VVYIRLQCELQRALRIADLGLRISSTCEQCCSGGPCQFTPVYRRDMQGRPAGRQRYNTDLPPDRNNISAERGPYDYDRTHVFTSNFICYLPRLARGSLNQPVLRPVLNGWQLSGIVRMWSGYPLDAVMNYDVAGIGGTQNQRPNAIADAQGPRTTDQWFNRNAFARPANGTFGNLGRNALRGPGVNKWDIALFKNFKVSEGKNVQFRGEMFNAFNHPSFITVGRTLSTTATAINPLASNFAVVTDTRDARVVQFGLKLTF